MNDMMDMMKKAKEVQEKMQQLQRDLVHLEITGTSGGGLVNVILNGQGDMKGIKIDPSLIKPEEVEILEDLIIAAHNEAKVKIKAAVEEKTQSIRAELPIPPGIKLPFE
ncbi:YbaB/EbfC family nucleoid-associated protein [Bartonella sp. F02]|uniref:YbaB/EbfC family nucleoid-associated protein n=1 Tax=Bartonella sp. F02 TaxID=2967262 RepID=UPI0022A97174|nr:YbaB/EbfC family nucleoid-associated protein [Bartonella sp. F02]MCZ2328071.1 YbaB/EbfC family nucleoid-associated protein [Bartonella sp. F02]